LNKKMVDEDLVKRKKVGLKSCRRQRKKRGNG
jgi:hypothetical protein